MEVSCHLWAISLLFQRGRVSVFFHLHQQQHRWLEGRGNVLSTPSPLDTSEWAHGSCEVLVVTELGAYLCRMASLSPSVCSHRKDAWVLSGLCQCHLFFPHIISPGFLLQAWNTEQRGPVTSAAVRRTISRESLTIPLYF